MTAAPMAFMTVVMTPVISNNRRRPRIEIEAAIFEAAIGLFKARGYAATTVDEIVRAAAVAKGTFFNFFPTKQHVLAAHYQSIDIEIAAVRRALKPSAPLKALSRYAREVEAIFMREGALMLELLELTIADPAMRRMDSDSGACDADEFATFLVDVQRKGLIAASVDPMAAADAIIDLWSGAVRIWLRNPTEGALVKPFDVRMALLFKGLGYDADTA